MKTFGSAMSWRDQPCRTGVKCLRSNRFLRLRYQAIGEISDLHPRNVATEVAAVGVIEQGIQIFFLKEIIFFSSSKVFNSESKNLIFLNLNV